MQRYIGLDVHKESTTAVAVSSAGRRLWTKVTETSAEALIELVRSVPRPRCVVMEEGTYSEWLYEAIRPHADDVIVLIPERRNRTQSKSDEADATALAEAARVGRIKRRVFKDTSCLTTLREAVRSYQGLTRDLVRTQLRLRTLVRSRGVAVTADQILKPELRSVVVGQLPERYQPRARLLGEQLDGLNKLRQQALQRLRTEARRHAAVKLLATAPGIGPLRAAVIVAVVVSPHRFRTKRQFWSYCGLAVVTVASAQWTRQEGEWVTRDVALPRGLNRNRNPWLKDVFKGAAHVVVTQMPKHPLHEDYLRLVRDGTKESLAKVTLARRIAAACLAMWKHKEAYDTTKHQSRKTA